MLASGVVDQPVDVLRARYIRATTTRASSTSERRRWGLLAAAASGAAATPAATVVAATAMLGGDSSPTDLAKACGAPTCASRVDRRVLGSVLNQRTPMTSSASCIANATGKLTRSGRTSCRGTVSDQVEGAPHPKLALRAASPVVVCPRSDCGSGRLLCETRPRCSVVGQALPSRPSSILTIGCSLLLRRVAVAVARAGAFKAGPMKPSNRLASAIIGRTATPPPK
jgi:hypothetical protein